MKTSLLAFSVTLTALIAVACDSKPTDLERDRQVRENPTAPPSEKVTEMPPESEPPPVTAPGGASQGTRSDYQPSTGPGGAREEGGKKVPSDQ